ncbi:hypothetical protein HRG_009461 [Hirsutella rhossiliensis]|uniref:Uncharacterized protein n=1 Tax=Hirsutella rhossiliensis TaxID=111463 RepID=A0A9P8MR71_9HYPO|nr:uncharacterized protein HRG_09461 [Hirsutella rhossiliensis]KAH0959679.1 hypothetical protein HRG_09461 [Hirsutella rhossiliensis]
MSVHVEWACSTPNGGLATAMERLARQIAEEGEYYEVAILSTPKTASGGRSAKPHFKVRLLGTNNRSEVTHEHLIKIEHRSATGHSSRYVTNRQARGPGYSYETLVATNGPPTGCPKRRRLQREAEAAAGVPDGWYPDPQAAYSGKAERYFANGQWTEHTR